MNRHCKTITRKPIVAQSSIPIEKMDAIVLAIQNVLTVVETNFVPFVSATVDAIVMMMRSMPWFNGSSL